MSPLDGLPEIPPLEISPTTPLVISFDVNGYLQDHSEEELWRLLGALKDFFAPAPKDLQT